MSKANIDKIIEQMGVANLAKPIGDLRAEPFPETVDGLTLKDIGDWIIRLSGWEAYLLTQLGDIESDLIVTKESFDLGISKFSEGAKLTVKAAEFKATQEDEAFRKAKHWCIG